MRKTPALILLLLASCNSQPEAPLANQPVEQPVPQAAPPPAHPKPFTLEEENELVDFSFGWSAEAAAVPELVDRFRARMARVRAQLIAGAKADKAEREKSGFEFHQYQSSTDYSTAGQSGRLLSLEANVSEFTGGAHPNHGTIALLWDRQAKREVKFADLFVDPRNRDRLLTQRWCDALNKEREEKRGAPVGGEGLFDDCPSLDQIAIVPIDGDDDGLFDKLALIAGPYVAGPYVEGDYEIELNVTNELKSALKSEYRDSFEAA